MNNQVILLFGFSNGIIEKFINKLEQPFEYKITTSVDHQCKIILFFLNKNKIDQEIEYIEQLSEKNKIILTYENIPDSKILYQCYLHGIAASLDIYSMNKLPQIINQASDIIQYYYQ